MKGTLRIAFSLLLPAGLAAAGEHPGSVEHPTARPDAAAAEPAEHPAGHEHPIGSKPWTRRMRKEFTQAVKDFVRDSSAGGAYAIRDEKLGKEWRLKLKSVHTRRIVHLGEQSFFACADFKSVAKGEKDMLDLDFYASKDKDGWRIDQVLIHKLNGEPRYTYNEKNERVPVSR